MKKFFIYLAIGAAAAALLCSCSKKEEKTLAEKAVGSYPVTCDVTIPGAPAASSNATLVLTEVDANNVKLVLEGFNMGEGVIPVEVTKVALREVDGNIAFSDYSGNISYAGAQAPGTLKGTLKKGDTPAVDLDVEVTVSAEMKVTIKVANRK